MAACQDGFCSQGAGGYVAFAEAAIAWTRANAAPLGVAFVALVAMQALALVNTWRLRTRYAAAPPILTRV